MSLPLNPSKSFIARNPHLYGHHPKTQLRAPEPPQQAPALGGDDEGKAQGAGCPAIRFVVRRVRPLDEDAKHGACKDLVDGLRHAGLIHSDAAGQIRLEVEQEKVMHFADQETLIELTLP